MDAGEVLKLIEGAVDQVTSDIAEESLTAALEIASMLNVAHLVSEIMMLLQNRLNALLEKVKESQ